jgi:hypothetical protein
VMVVWAIPCRQENRIAKTAKSGLLIYSCFDFNREDIFPLALNYINVN